MRRFSIILFLSCLLCSVVHAQLLPVAKADTSVHGIDTTITFRDVNYYIFKNPADQNEFYRDLDRIRVVLPYVRMARRMYAEAEEKRAEDSKREFRHYRKDTEKDLRAKFEKDVKNLYISEGKVLFKLLGRETKETPYHIIKSFKGGFSAWTYQIVAKHYTYDLKEEYDPHKEWILEMAIRYLGPEYNPN